MGESANRLGGIVAVVHSECQRATIVEAIVPAVQALGRRHAGYGVRAEHYDTVGAALLWTLERGLGDAFDPETRDAWAAAYGTLASVMIEAAADAEGEAAAA